MSRTRPPKAVRSIFYIHSRRRYDPGNNPMNFLAIYVTKMLDHNRKRISDFDIDEISNIELWCNNLPRKILGYRTPDEVFEDELDSIYSLHTS